jgi:hypothetical protein
MPSGLLSLRPGTFRGWWLTSRKAALDQAADFGVSLDKSPDGYRSVRYWPLAGAPLIYGGNEALLCIELQRATLAPRGRATNLFYTFHIFYVDVNDATHYNIVIGPGKEDPMTDQQFLTEMLDSFKPGDAAHILQAVKMAADGMITEGEMVAKLKDASGIEAFEQHVG